MREWPRVNVYAQPDSAAGGSLTNKTLDSGASEEIQLGKQLFNALYELDVDKVTTALEQGAKLDTSIWGDSAPVISCFLEEVAMGRVTYHARQKMGFSETQYYDISSRPEADLINQKLQGVLRVLKDRAGLDANMKFSDGSTLFMRVCALAANSDIGAGIFGFLMANGADATLTVDLQLPAGRLPEGQKPPTITALTCVLDKHSLIFGHGGGGGYVSQHRKAGIIARLIEAGAPLEGKVGGRSVMEEILDQKYPIGRIQTIMDALFKREPEITAIPHHKHLLHAVISQTFDSDWFVKEAHGHRLTDTIHPLNLQTTTILVGLVKKLIENGVDVNAEVEISQYSEGRRSDVPSTPIETAMRQYINGGMNIGMTVPSEVLEPYTVVKLLLGAGVTIPERMVDTPLANSDIKIAYATQQLQGSDLDSSDIPTLLLEREFLPGNVRPQEAYCDFLLENGAKVTQEMIAHLEASMQKRAESSGKAREPSQDHYDTASINAKLQVAFARQQGHDVADLASKLLQHEISDEIALGTSKMSPSAVKFLLNNGARVDEKLVRRLEPLPEERIGAASYRGTWYEYFEVGALLNIALMSERLKTERGAINTKDEQGHNALDRALLIRSKQIEQAEASGEQVYFGFQLDYIGYLLEQGAEVSDWAYKVVTELQSSPERRKIQVVDQRTGEKKCSNLLKAVKEARARSNRVDSQGQ
jgi:hypothetical protein